MKMNKKLEKLCRFLIENKVSDKDLIVGFDENLVIYKDFEWDLERDEVEISDFRPFDYAKLKITDIDGYKLTIFEDGTIEVETPETEDEEIESAVKILLESCNINELKALLEHLKFMQENADLFTKIYVDIPKIEVR